MKDLETKYKRDAKGNLVHLDNIREIDLLRDELVRELVAKANTVSDALANFKESAMEDINAFVGLSAERYNIKIGGAKGNITLTSFDGEYKIQHAVQDTLTFDEGLQAAKVLIDECLNEWTKDSRPEVHALIDNAFDVDKEGNINTQRVLGLRRLNIEDEKWQRAMSAVSESLQVQTSKAYVRIYRRDKKTQKYNLLNLDIANI